MCCNPVACGDRVVPLAGYDPGGRSVRLYPVASGCGVVPLAGYDPGGPGVRFQPEALFYRRPALDGVTMGLTVHCGLAGLAQQSSSWFSDSRLACSQYALLWLLSTGIQWLSG